VLNRFGAVLLAGCCAVASDTQAPRPHGLPRFMPLGYTYELGTNGEPEVYHDNVLSSVAACVEAEAAARGGQKKLHSTSRYIGVTWDKSKGKWLDNCCKWLDNCCWSPPRPKPKPQIPVTWVEV
jgi:hypothetical protein